MFVDLGIPPKVLFSWTHVSLFDVAIGSISVGTKAYDLVLVLTGELPWGSETIIMSLTGAVAYWKHIIIPEPDMFAEIAYSLFAGVGVGVLGRY